jgi:glycosyltransferase involved in cell wall biosynthesis
LLFERDDVDGLVEQLARLLTDRALRADYAHRAVARAEEFSWDRTWEQFRSSAFQCRVSAQSSTLECRAVA